MKGTEHFTRTIAEYLNQRAMADPLFAPNLMKPNKNIEECITYILNEVQKSGCNGFDDDDELLRALPEKSAYSDLWTHKKMSLWISKKELEEGDRRESQIQHLR